jgi:Tfp pilus assembly protein PilO
MASRIDAITKLPPWQLALLFLGVAGLLGVGWYQLFYVEAVETREAGERGLEKAQAELAAMEEKKANFEQEMQAAAQVEKELEAKRAVLPESDATVDHLMRKFQQQARLVGLNVEKWNPQGESKLDFYAKLPIAIEATGTWHQVGEFFRRVSELQQIVNVEEVSLEVGKDFDGTHPLLDVEFVAATFRYLPESERGPSDDKARRRTEQR